MLHSFLYEQSGAHHTTLLSPSTYATAVRGYFLNSKLYEILKLRQRTRRFYWLGHIVRLVRICHVAVAKAFAPSVVVKASVRIDYGHREVRSTKRVIEEPGLLA